MPIIRLDEEADVRRGGGMKACMRSGDSRRAGHGGSGRPAANDVTGAVRRRVLAAIAAIAGWGSGSLQAQPAPRPAAGVMPEDNVNPEALVDALTLPDPTKPQRLRRGFRPVAPAGQASLLITFRTGSAELTPKAASALDAMAEAMRSERLSTLGFRIEGHADSRGDPQRNLALSQSRAEAVVAYLVTRHELRPDRLRAVGRGSSQPLNTEQADAPENRRVTFISVAGGRP